LQSRWSATNYLNLDASYYYYGSTPSPAIPALHRVDIGVSTPPRHGFSFSVWARNITSDRHPETAGTAFINGQIPRTVVFKILWESRQKEAKAAH
jgi:outer membrane receptor protein involved in Fe transport